MQRKHISEIEGGDALMQMVKDFMPERQFPPDSRLEIEVIGSADLAIDSRPANDHEVYRPANGSDYQFPHIIVTARQGSLIGVIPGDWTEVIEARSDGARVNASFRNVKHFYTVHTEAILDLAYTSHPFSQSH